jgi:spermidine synthase
LMISIGGAIGGLFVAMAAPRWFHTYLEFPIGLVASVVLVTCVLWNVRPGQPRPLWLRAAMVLATIGFAAYLATGEVKKDREYVLLARNFYGTLKVRDDPATNDTPAERVLMHGTIDHGSELLGPGMDRTPTSYFGRNSGVFRAVQAVGASGPVRIGVLGLGAGVTATLARAGDTLHYYEINPLVVQIANSEFGFFRACPADKQLFLGDGRLVLERLPDEHLDVLIMDAFSSDAIPMHLLTREAYQIYDRHLNPGGVLVVHISNRYMNLEPVVARAAADMGWSGVTVSDEGESESYYSGSTWVVVSRTPRIFENAALRTSGAETLKPTPGFRPWTDDYSNIFQILK